MDVGAIRALHSRFSQAEVLDFDNSSVIYDQELVDVKIGMEQKLICILRDKLFDTSADLSQFLYLCGDTFFVNARCMEPIYKCNSGGEFLLEADGIYSTIIDDLTVYYDKSPYWSIGTRSLNLEEYVDAMASSDGMSFDAAMELITSSAFSFFDSVFGKGVIGDDLITQIESGVVPDPKEYFSEYDEYQGGLIYYISELYPYFLKNENLFTELEVLRIKKAGEALSNTFSVGHTYVDGLEKAYFFSYDDGVWSYSGEAGESWLGELNLGIMTAGWLIDAMILEKDEQFNFLPAELKKNAAVKVTA